MRLFLFGFLISISAIAQQWDIISPVMPQRQLVATQVRFIGDVATLMRQRGYRPENNCLQITQAPWNHQELRYRLEISPWACPRGAMLVEKPAMVVWFRAPYTTLMSEDGRVDLGRIGYTPAVTGQPVEWFVTELCAFEYASRCDLYLDKEGRITWLSVRP